MDSKNRKKDPVNQVFEKNINRRKFLKDAASAACAAGTMVVPGYAAAASHKPGKTSLKWKEYFKGNYRLMTEKEKKSTVRRLEKLAKLKNDIDVKISSRGPLKNVLYGYAFNITRCKGYMDCVKACVQENNLDRKSNTQYIRIFEMQHGEMDIESGNGKYYHRVPVDDHFYMGVQCFHCAKPVCIKACPVQATWKEKDGMVVVDYDWCIGCRYCHAACPYWGRRFNWNKPQIPLQEITKKQHYLGNRLRPKGVIEKCTFCIQRSREGKLPACVDACPTGSRVFGNLLDPDSEIRFVLDHKKVFRLKVDLGTEPQFWYFMD